MSGDILGGRYVLSGFLGAGGMAEVYLAHDRMLDRDLALKVLREGYAKDARTMDPGAGGSAAQEQYR